MPKIVLRTKRAGGGASDAASYSPSFCHTPGWHFHRGNASADSRGHSVLSKAMGFTHLAVMLSVTMIQLVSGMSFMTPEPDTPPTSTPDSYPLGDLIHAALQSKEYLGDASASTGTTTNPTQAVPGLGQTESTATVISPGLLTTALSSSSAASQTGSRNTMSSLPIEEETTTTLITTTTITTMHMPVQCNETLSAMEDVVESPDPASSSSSFSPLECTYSITVYAGYGVEIQVRKVNLSKKESLTIMGYGGLGPELLANETLMREGQVIRSTTNQVYIHYRSLRQNNHGVFSLHYQAFLLSCPFPQSPEGGGVTVTDIHPGGQAHFHCDPGFQVRGHEVATCVNTTQPHWSTPEPQCVAVSCGGWIRNATVGRILSPTPPSVSNHSNGNNLSCHWLIEAKEGHRLHLHFERIALDEDDDKLIVRSGNSSLSPPLFDSDLDDVPERGLLSESSTLYLELTADSSSIPLLLALRYEAFDDEHCWEPYMPHGNFSSSDITYQLGTTVTFTCSPGFVMEQGSGTIECVDPSSPHWNDSEPVCRALCGGELTEPSGTILSPDWPQSYSKGLDCVWQIHGNEEKRVELDVQILNIRHTDVLTVFDGRDLMSHVIGQYLGSKERFQIVSGGSEVTIQFQSDADDSSFILSQGFLIHYREVEPNDTCPTLPQIDFGWISSSHSSPVRGSVLTYQCQPGYDISGSDIITCQWDLSWSSSPPTCVKVQQCPDPGEVVNGARSVRPEAGFAVGTVVRFSCNQGYQLEGPSQISCHGRDTGTPKWSDRSPKCVLKYDPCPNPGVPDNGYQTLYKHSYQAGETLRFFCYEGYELIGEVIISCVPGHPSQWNSPPPFCKVAYEELLDDHKLEVSQSFEPSHQILSENIALAIILPIILVILLIGGIYMYYTNICRLEWKPLFWKSLSHTHSYSPITVESDFNNPLYEAGDTREYEVSI
ncbi:seizure protein 6 homolog isoform X1 [Centropristis striata]|uniref:seizure protein 6 homolog isoform X1 n=2 Tax=Centropristis striata TaxID=184440 RepID=UPI0027E1BCA4|nr:seizure protein 6 homolog isoform X1 [Centropristis striata]